MKRTVYLCLQVVLVFLALAGLSLSDDAAGSESSDEYVFKVAVENRLEQRLIHVLSGIVGTGKLTVIANADVETDLKKIAERRKVKPKTDDGPARLVLPGVPVKKEIGAEDKSDLNLPAVPPSVINSLNVTILLDTSVPENLMDTVREVAIRAIGYNPDRGDILNIRKVGFEDRNYDWASLLYPPNLYWLILICLGSLFLLVLTVFFLDPFKKLTATLRSFNWETVRTGSSQAASAARGGSVVEKEEIPAEARLNGDRPMPFSFVQDRHVQDLGFLMKDAPALEVAIVANYLSPDLATKLIECFDDGKQAEIAIRLSGEEVVDPDRVQALEDSLKAKLDYVVGGDDRLAPILDFTDDDLRDRIFSQIESTDASAANRLRQRVKSFESIMRELSPHAMQALFRQVDATTFARLLKSSPEDILNRVLQSLSEGAVERLREEMELSRPLTEANLKKERMNIVSIVRRMSKAGLIEEYF